MGKYDFTTVLNRRGQDCIAANICPIEGVTTREGFDEIPLWVADMSFPTAPAILEAMRRRLEFPNLGYYSTPDTWYDAIIRWQQRRNGVQGLTREHIGYENGVLGGVSAAVQLLTRPGEPILLHSPTYIGFTHVLETLGRKIVHSELKRDGDGIWRMDYADMEKKLHNEHIHVAILCSPHNPTGRVWERRELERAMELFARCGVTVISDEIWSDLILPGHTHIPTQSISEDARQRTIAFYAPSKTFSLAGLVGSYHIIYNDTLRDELRRQSALSHYNSGSVLSTYALIGAYDESEDWLDELCRVIDGNMRYACDYIAAHFPGVRVMRSEGTYMLFLDCGDYCRAHGVSIGELLRRGAEVGVWWQNGEPFQYPDAIRMNLALPLSQLQKAMERLRKYAFIEVQA